MGFRVEGLLFIRLRYKVGGPEALCSSALNPNPRAQERLKIVPFDLKKVYQT